MPITDQPGGVDRAAVTELADRDGFGDNRPVEHRCGRHDGRLAGKHCRSSSNSFNVSIPNYSEIWMYPGGHTAHSNVRKSDTVLRRLTDREKQLRK